MAEPEWYCTAGEYILSKDVVKRITQPIKPDIPRDVLKLWRAFDRYGVLFSGGCGCGGGAAELKIDGVQWEIRGSASHAWRIGMFIPGGNGKGPVCVDYTDAEVRAQYAKNPVSLETKQR